jgi:alkylation response protein AidB-like acyl-CoA dehydrogenase
MRVDDNGNIVGRNDVNTIGIEHKMGLKGSATAVLAFGEDNDCLGYILGDPPGEDGKGQGMAQMFQMMNEARLETGHAALAETVVAYHNAAAYASERIQGRPITNPKSERLPIIKHEDVKNAFKYEVLYRGHAGTDLKNYWYLDVVRCSKDPERVKRARPV